MSRIAATVGVDCGTAIPSTVLGTGLAVFHGLEAHATAVFRQNLYIGHLLPETTVQIVLRRRCPRKRNKKPGNDSQTLKRHTD
jgi:hypothetical protein